MLANLIAIPPRSGERSYVTSLKCYKNEKNSDALDTGRVRHAVTMGDIPSLERFLVHPRGKSRFMERKTSSIYHITRRRRVI